jgi:N utilization substance protein B
MTEGTSGAARADRIRALRSGRRLALASVFEADFGQRTAGAVLERHLAEVEKDPDAAILARRIVGAVVENRADIDALIERIAPQYPVTQLARMDRAILRCAVGEVLHSAATPTRVAIAEWVELARTYSGDPARRLVNGVLGRVAAEPREPAGRSRTSRPSPEGTSGPPPSEPDHRPEPDPDSDGPSPASNSEEGVRGHHVRSAQEDRG